MTKTLLKATYDVSAFFSLKGFNDGHLKSAGLVVPMITTIKGALLGQVIQQRGLAFAREHHDALRDTKVFIQFPDRFVQNQTKVNLITNAGLNAKGTIKQMSDVDKYRTVGIKGFTAVEQVVFYIEDTIEGLDHFLKGIQILGDSDSQVGLRTLEEARELENVLLPYSIHMGYDSQIDPIYDWSPDSTFDEHYAYSTYKVRKNNNTMTMCAVESSVTATEAIERWDAGDVTFLD